VVNSPIVHIIFNRPRVTEETFKAIRAQRPSRLFIIADGPRPGNPSDIENCRQTRAVVEHIDWPCEVSRDYADQNLGCKMRPKTGIDWVFSHVDQAIILEDDCLPHPDFFMFCDELLEKYRYDERVSVITGDNFQNGNRRGGASYYFSKYNHAWGWATWKRAWLLNDSGIAFWPELRASSAWRSLHDDKVERQYWDHILDTVHAGRFESAWDYPWSASLWYRGGLTATPNVNLVTNIGFGPDATHALAPTTQDGVPTQAIGPITHPQLVQRDREADRYTFDHVYGGPWLRKRSRRRTLTLPVRAVRKAIRILRSRYTRLGEAP
jgi:hypothetical protein